MKSNLFFLLSVLLLSCGNTTDAKDNNVEEVHSVEKVQGVQKIMNVVPPDTLDVAVGCKLVLTTNIDLKKHTVVIPDGVTLVAKGGVLKNGTLVGNNTKIYGKKALFDHVTIKGTWSVPNISTEMFKDLNYDNALSDVVALSSDKVQNNIYIEKGTYVLDIKMAWGSAIAPASNTNIKIDGTLTLKPNSFDGCQMINICGNNIHIYGKGQIVGDKSLHTGTKGEWGMGINFAKASNCSIDGLTIKNCWGDCIYVGTDSQNITINNCKLENGRRQGISITSADGVVVADCVISDVGGTDPGYAIDVEPNANETVQNVTIRNVVSDNCEGGFLLYSGRDNKSYIGNVSIYDSKVTGSSKNSISIEHSYGVKINGNFISSCTSKYAFFIDNSENVNVSNNKVSTDYYLFHDTEGIVAKGNKIIKGSLSPMIILHGTKNKLK